MNRAPTVANWWSQFESLIVGVCREQMGTSIPRIRRIRQLSGEDYGDISEVTGIGPFSLFLLLFSLFIVLSRFTKESSCFLFDPLILQVVENVFLLSDNAMEGEGKVSDGFLNIVLGLLKFQLGAFQGIPRRPFILLR